MIAIFVIDLFGSSHFFSELYLQAVYTLKFHCNFLLSLKDTICMQNARDFQNKLFFQRNFYVMFF